jgi:hypothetical protein
MCGRFYFFCSAHLVSINLAPSFSADKTCTNNMPGTRIVLKGNEPDPDPAPYLYVSAEHKKKNAEKPYDPKRSCWVPDPDEKFIEGLIQDQSGAKIKVQLLKNKEVKEYKADQVTQVNPPKFDMCEDMSGLTYLNDASVLWNLKARYVEKLIYVRFVKMNLSMFLIIFWCLF